MTSALSIRLLAALALFLPACGTMRMHVKPSGPAEPALQHVVLVQLDDPKLADEMTKDMLSAFPDIPQVRSWHVGPRVDTGRAGAPDWYTLGIVTTFDSVADYKAFLAHPRHQRLAERWKPHWKRAEVYDFGTLAP